MRLSRFQDSEARRDRIGLIIDGAIRDVSSVLDDLPSLRWPLPSGDLLIANLAKLRPKMEKLAASARPLPLGEVTLLSPVANPNKVICGAGNWPHPERPPQDPGKRGLLFKVSSAVVGVDEGVVLRWPERYTAHEMELAVIIGTGGTRIPASEALEHVAGYSIGLDMTLQGPEFHSYCKSIDTFGVIGPWLVTTDEIPDPGKLGFKFWVNDELRQADHFGRLLYDIPKLIEYASAAMTLYPGDIVLSGTPGWTIGPVVPGDVMHAEIDVIGRTKVNVFGPDHRPSIIS
jgi:2-keto-4-pentenoate hydratase/2-oxohepta-3-ene-1,7-dioic acid hydratase in catechol pathway